MVQRGGDSLGRVMSNSTLESAITVAEIHCRPHILVHGLVAEAASREKGRKGEYGEGGAEQGKGGKQMG